MIRSKNSLAAPDAADSFHQIAHIVVDSFAPVGATKLAVRLLSMKQQMGKKTKT
jgi:hypothetical protein